jgi:hypothetical protein
MRKSVSPRSVSHRSVFLTALVSSLWIVLGLATPAHSQASRTWVSGVGDDANPCSRTAPCKTFAGAISKTAVNGEINCLDPGGFGALTITKSITIDCAGTLGSILAPSTNGINVNGAGVVVAIRNVTISGVNSGFVGINFVQGATLHVENVVIRGFRSGSAIGLRVAFGTAAELYVTDTIISNNGSGIVIRPTANADVAAALARVTLQNNSVDGLNADATGSTAAIRAHITDSVIDGNANFGVAAIAPAGASSLVATNRIVVTGNGTGIQATGATGRVILNASTVTENSRGVNVASGGTVSSYGNNALIGNRGGNNGDPTDTVPLK